MTQSALNNIQLEENINVLSFLKGKSAHGDTAIRFLELTRELAGIKTYCPNGKNFSYVLSYTNDSVFGFCIGMQSISLKIPESMLQGSVQVGGGILR